MPQQGQLVALLAIPASLLAAGYCWFLWAMSGFGEPQPDNDGAMLLMVLFSVCAVVAPVVLWPRRRPWKILMIATATWSVVVIGSGRLPGLLQLPFTLAAVAFAAYSLLAPANPQVSLPSSVACPWLLSSSALSASGPP